MRHDDRDDSAEALAAEQWEQGWIAEVAARTRAIDDNRAEMVPEDEAVTRMFRRASAETR